MPKKKKDGSPKEHMLYRTFSCTIIPHEDDDLESISLKRLTSILPDTPNDDYRARGAAEGNYISVSVAFHDYEQMRDWATKFAEKMQNFAKRHSAAAEIHLPEDARATPDAEMKKLTVEIRYPDNVQLGGAVEVLGKLRGKYKGSSLELGFPRVIGDKTGSFEADMKKVEELKANEDLAGKERRWVELMERRKSLAEQEPGLLGPAIRLEAVGTEPEIKELKRDIGRSLVGQFGGKASVKTTPATAEQGSWSGRRTTPNDPKIR